MEPGHHDRIFAESRTFPTRAYALVHAVGTADVEGENVLSYTAGGFRDLPHRLIRPGHVAGHRTYEPGGTPEEHRWFSSSLAELRQRTTAAMRTA